MSASRTVTVDTVDYGLVELPEPSWCIGHARELGAGTYRNDITHHSVRAKTWVQTETYGRENVLKTWVSWAPFAELLPLVGVELDILGDYAAEDALTLARSLRAAACRLERVAAEAIRLRGEIR